MLDAEGSQFTEGVLTGTVEVPTDGALTFYSRHGELFAKVCAGLTLLFVLARRNEARQAQIRVAHCSGRDSRFSMHSLARWKTTA